MSAWSALAALALAACDFPTEAPIFEPRFLIPVDSAEMLVGQFLPRSVAVRGDSFAMALERARASLSLGQLCAACRASGGIPAIKPGFANTITVDVPLPEDVNSITGASGTITVELTHDFNFDLLRPGPSARGSITLAVTVDGVPIAEDSILGSAQGFAPRSTINRVINFTLPGTARTLTVTATIESPEGAPTRLNNSDSFTLTVTPGIILASAINVNVTDRDVRAQQLEIDLTNLDEKLDDHIKFATMKLKIFNPFPVFGTLIATFTGPGVNVAPKSFALVPFQSTQSVALTVPELTSMTGSVVTTTVIGLVNGPRGGVTMIPANRLVIAIQLDMTLSTERVTNGHNFSTSTRSARRIAAVRE
jgi:hypothetical protein